MSDLHPLFWRIICELLTVPLVLDVSCIWVHAHKKNPTFEYINVSLDLNLSLAVRYELNQDPYLLKTGNIDYSSPCLIVLSPDGRSVAIASDNSLSVHNAVTGKEEETFSHVFSGTVIGEGKNLSGFLCLCIYPCCLSFNYSKIGVRNICHVQ